MSKTRTVLRGRVRPVAVMLLASFLAPLLVLTMPNVAEAAAAEGAWFYAEASEDIALTPWTIDCSADFRYESEAGSYKVRMEKGSCWAPWGFEVADGGDAYSIVLAGEGGGGACEFSTSGTFVNAADDTWRSEHGDMADGVFTISNTTPCEVVEACFVVGGNMSKYGNGDPVSVCTPLNMGTPSLSAPPSACNRGEPYQAYLGTVPTTDQSDWYLPLFVKFRGVQDNPIGYEFSYDKTDMNGTTPIVRVNSGNLAVAAGSSTVEFQSWYKYATWVYPGTVPPAPPGGGNPPNLQIWSKMTPPVGGSFDGADTSTRQNTPQNVTGGTLGLTIPEKCLFFFGEKVASVLGNDTDEPVSGTPLGGNPGEPSTASPDIPPHGAPAGDEAACTFEWSDPTTWASGGICAVVAVLMRIYDTLTGLPAAIMNKLSGILSDLFIPSNGFMAAQQDSLASSWDGTAVAKWKTAVAGQSFSGAASGCGGLPVAWSMGGKDFSFTLLGACTGPMVNVAAVIKLIMTASLVIFGGLTCLRALGSGFGWNPGVGRSEGA